MQKSDEFHKCYLQSQANENNTNGVVKHKLKISNGIIIKNIVVQNTTGSKELEDCNKSIFLTINFSEIKGHADIHWPFTYRNK